MRRLNTEAAKAVKYGGVSPEEALAMITLNPARQMGIDAYVGSIDPGKQADLVVYDKDPLSIYAKVERVFVDGVEYFNREADLAGRAEKEARKKGLMEKERARQKQNAPRPDPNGRRPS
jgi:adenine deaminase